MRGKADRVVIDFKANGGLNTKSDPIRLRSNELVLAVNVDIDDSGLTSRREGTTRIHAVAHPHSLWGDSEYCFFVAEGVLYRLRWDWSVESLLSGLHPDLPMHFTRVNDMVIYTNAEVYGYVSRGTRYDFDAPTKPFKVAMKPGMDGIESFNNRVYTVTGNEVSYSDPMDIGQRDTRSPAMSFPAPITMFCAVSDGIYISSDRTYFLKGLSPMEFVAVPVSDSIAIRGTAVKVPGPRVITQPNVSAPENPVAMWASNEGIFMGKDGGDVTNLTVSRLIMPDVARGSAVFRINRNNAPQYIAAMTN